MVKGNKHSHNNNKSTPQGVNNGGQNNASFSFHNVTNSNGQQPQNQHHMTTQSLNNPGSSNISTNTFLGTFKRKADIYHHLKHNNNYFLPEIKQITMQHLSQIQSGVVKCLKTNQLNINKIHNISGVSDAQTIFNHMTTDPMLVPYTFQTPKLIGNTIERHQLELPVIQSSRIIASVKPDWQNQIYLPAFTSWKDGSNGNLTSGLMTIKTEIAETMNLAIVRGGTSRGGKKLVRSMQLESMLQTSEAFRNGLAQFSSSTSNTSPQNVDINEYIRNGNITSRTNQIDKLSKQELVNIILTANDNKYTDLQSLINNQGNISYVAQQQETDERTKFISKYQKIQFKLAGINYVDSNSLNLNTRNEEFLDTIEYIIDTCVQNQSVSGLETSEINYCNQYICNLLEQLCR